MQGVIARTTHYKGISGLFQIFYIRIHLRHILSVGPGLANQTRHSGQQPTSPTRALQACATMLGFSYGFWGSNSGHHAYEVKHFMKWALSSALTTVSFLWCQSWLRNRLGSHLGLASGKACSPQTSWINVGNRIKPRRIWRLGWSWGQMIFFFIHALNKRHFWPAHWHFF